MFDIARFVAECETAIVTDRGREEVRELLRAAISDPSGIVAAFGRPKRAGVQALHRSPSLTILQIVWPPSFTQTPHNHLLWAETGVYAGREDNVYWRRTPGAKWSIEAIGASSLCTGSCLSLEHDVIHSVTNPLDTVTAGLHVYGGNLSQGAPRSAWDGETLVEKELDYARDDRADEIYADLAEQESLKPRQGVSVTLLVSETSPESPGQPEPEASTSIRRRCRARSA
jgi:predicted metal-dependent enzyme (double-stranded beta helix superfamily)